MSGSPTEIYSAANPQQAYLLKGLLEEAGIAAWVVNDSIQIAGGELPMGWAAAPRVMVGENDASDARRVAEAFDRQTAHAPTPDDPNVVNVEGTEWSEWPKCPECGERRAVRCPICSVSGTHFPLADIEDDDNGSRVFLICDGCDDHFLPEFFRRCHRCGYDYGDGVETDAHAGPESASVHSLGIRGWIIVGAMLVGLVLMAVYFAWVLRQPPPVTFPASGSG